MRLLIQRVAQASVSIGNHVSSTIGLGLVVFIGITHTDTLDIIPKLVRKLLELRIFEDDQGKMNLSLLAKKGELLIVSQFTLYADCRRGRRPDFIEAAPPHQAEKLYNAFVEQAKQSGLNVQTGQFAAHMQVSLLNDGPVTLLLDSDNL
jgi:D-aminoacyl-tRNA deacylase